MSSKFILKLFSCKRSFNVYLNLSTGWHCRVLADMSFKSLEERDKTSFFQRDRNIKNYFI